MPARDSQRPTTAEDAAASDSPAPLDADAGTDPAAGAEETPGEDVPMNRAERRAKAKGKHPDHMQPPVGKIMPHHMAQAHGKRSYSNRRSGGS
jgi:hypothetical protein